MPCLHPQRHRLAKWRHAWGALQKEDAAVEAVRTALAVLDAHLAQRTFLVGHAVTLADIVAGANLFHGFTKVAPSPVPLLLHGPADCAP